MNYTARDGGELLREAAQQAAVNPPQQQPGQTAEFPTQPNLGLFSLKHEFPGEWNRFLHPADTATSQTMTLTLPMERFPFQFRGKLIQLIQMDLFLKFKDIYNSEIFTLNSDDPTPAGDYADQKNKPLTLNLTPPGDPPTGF